MSDDWFKKVTSSHRIYDIDCLDDVPVPTPYEAPKCVDELFERSKKVKKIVHDARFSNTDKWVSIEAGWWRMWAQATKFVEEASQSVHTLPGGFSDLQTGYFMKTEDERKKLFVDYILNHFAVEEDRDEYLNEKDVAKKEEIFNRIQTPELLPKPLYEKDEIHQHVNIPFAAYKELVPSYEIDEEMSDVFIHKVIKVWGQKGIKGSDEPVEKEMRTIVDSFETWISCYFRNRCFLSFKSCR